MAFNPYIARVAGEAFDADQIEGDDPFYISDAELAQARVRDASNARRAARLLAAKPKPVCEVCGVTLPDAAECVGCSKAAWYMAAYRTPTGCYGVAL